MKEITPLENVEAIVEVPGSKSITQRAMICAALADGESTLLGPLASEDTKYTASALRAMGMPHRSIVTVNQILHRGAVVIGKTAIDDLPGAFRDAKLFPDNV